jgi:hypothetical protein
MTLSYKFVGGFVQYPGHPSAIKPGSYVIREACHAISPPLPVSAHIHCDFHQATLPDEENATFLQKSVDDGKATWRLTDTTQVSWLAYLDSARGWNLDTSAPLRSAGCEQGTNAESNQPWAQCTWLSSDGFREVIVDVRKPLSLKSSGGNFDRVPWVATAVQAYQCYSEPR